MTALLHLTGGSPEYSPLPLTGSFIRLLDILPGDHDTVLECNLRVASLRSQLSYMALSYAWIEENVGSSTWRQEGKSIICNRKLITIPRNLHSALWTFRLTTSILTLWVDFLCINQQDTQERNQQVRMMRSIYSNSGKVLIWLGPNVAGDHLGDGRVAYSGMDNNYKVVWHNDSRDEHMVRSYIERFSEYENLGERVLPITWSRDVFGAFSVFKQLAQGVYLKDLRFYTTSLTSTEQINWSVKVQRGVSAILDSSWVRLHASTYPDLGAFSFELIIDQWQRTWVIQETVLPRKAIVYLGHISAPWTMLAEGAATYVQELATSDLKASIFDDQNALSILSKVILDLESVRIARIEEIRSPLLLMLRRFRTKKSSDPRDKVFALLGLAKEQIQASIKLDYSLSVDEVMLRTAIALISENRGLEPLAGRVAGPDYLHSWVTNWNELPAGNERERLDCLRLYDASGGQSGIAHLHGQALLRLQGHFIDEIGYLGDAAPDSGFDRLRNFVTRWEGLRWANIPARSSTTGFGDEADAFWRTITADTLYVESFARLSSSGQDSKYRRATSDGSEAFRAWKRDDSNKRNRKTGFGPAGLTKNYVEPEELAALKNCFYYAVLTASGSRRFFGTRNGYIGIGPANLREGDTVCIVLGSRVPLIMRRRPQSMRCLHESVRNLFDHYGEVRTNTEVCNMLHEDIYALVGDAYVHGVMDGEFVRGSRESRSIFAL